IPFYTFSVPLRYLLLIIAIYKIVNGYFKIKDLNYNLIFIYSLFWLFFLGRVVYDLEFQYIPNGVFETNMGYYQAIIYVYFTSVSLFFIKTVDFTKVLKFSFIILFIGSLATIYINLNSPAEMIQRAEGRFEGAKGMSSIDYGHYGVSLSILSMILFSKFKGLKFRPLYIAGFFVGLFVMFLSGSRSPFLAL